MNRLQPFIVSNSTAVAMLQHGEAGQAIATLKSSLEKLRSQPDILQERVIRGNDQSSMIRSVPILSPRKLASKDESHFAFFPNAFLIAHDREELDVELIVSVLLYNLALSSHLVCLNAESREVGLLVNMTRQHYKTAMSLLLDSWDELVNGDQYLLLLATMNNLGYISSQNQYLQESQDMLSLSLDVIACAPAEMCPKVEEALGFFYTHLYCVDLSSFRSAPAA